MPSSICDPQRPQSSRRRTWWSLRPFAKDWQRRKRSPWSLKCAIFPTSRSCPTMTIRASCCAWNKLSTFSSLYNKALLFLVYGEKKFCRPYFLRIDWHQLCSWLPLEDDIQARKLTLPPYHPPKGEGHVQAHFDSYGRLWALGKGHQARARVGEVDRGKGHCDHCLPEAVPDTLRCKSGKVSQHSEKCCQGCQRSVRRRARHARSSL